jgi:hypothetical protein
VEALGFIRALLTHKTTGADVSLVNQPKPGQGGGMELGQAVHDHPENGSNRPFLGQVQKKLLERIVLGPMIFRRTHFVILIHFFDIVTDFLINNKILL